jgi:hypothetical protein
MMARRAERVFPSCVTAALGLGLHSIVFRPLRIDLLSNLAAMWPECGTVRAMKEVACLN